VIILDANVLIGFLDSTDPHHAACVELLERRFTDGFAASALTVAEAVVHPARVGRDDAAVAALAAIGLQIISVTAADVSGLARVRNVYRLRMPDAVALYTALVSHAELATFDASLSAAAAAAGVALAT
jgi:predicted nucleic acid-binding protein